MSYEQMAILYDKLMAHAPYEEWVRFTEDIFQESDAEIKRVADLGCGTGEITVQLAANDYEVTGVDASQEMLTVAAHKAAEKNLHVQWLLQDIRELQGLHEFDAAVSFCDVLNYITDPQDVSQAIANIYAILKPGGLFLFDVHDINFIHEYYINQTFAEVEDDISYIWFCSPGEEEGEMYHDLTFFYLQDDKFERFDEQHHQKTFPINFYKEILMTCGFENIKVYADFSSKPNNLEESPARIFFSAVKGPR